MASAVVQRHTRKDGCAVVELRGELDLASEVALRHLLLDLVREAPPGILVNLRHVSFIDSTGLGALVAGYKAARAAGIPYRVGQVAPFVERQIRLTGLDELLLGEPADGGPADGGGGEPAGGAGSAGR
jgi:anti-anti-sigma factor